MAGVHINSLSELHDKEVQWNVCVLVSRLWNYRGPTDNGTLKHTDLVVIDKEGSHMYVQIPAEASPRLMQTLQEGKVYLFRKFLCNPSRPAFSVVDSPYMIQCTRYTTVLLQPGVEDEYPYCTYNLVPFPAVSTPTDNVPRFIDVIGQITAVSALTSVQSMHQAQPSDTRTIVLWDPLGNELKLTLWGARAREFEADEVYALSKTNHVIAIFVGVLPKTLQGAQILSGSSACRWYINEDLPDIGSFCSSLGEEVAPIVVPTPMSPALDAIRVREAPIEITVQDLLALDPFENRNKPFMCTVTVNRLGFDQRWWFLSCRSCRKTTYVNGHQFRCSDNICPSVLAEPAYCIYTFANDATAEAEFMFFEKVARVVVGKPLMTLLTKKYPGCADIHEIAQMGGSALPVPLEVSRMVTKKYRLVVTISRKSISPASHQLSFQVSRIDHTFQYELGPLSFGHATGSLGPSSSGGSSSVGSLVIESSSELALRTPPSKNTASFGGNRTVPQSVIDELNTPISKLKSKAASSTPSGKSPCPTTSRCKLMSSSPIKASASEEIKTPVGTPPTTSSVLVVELTPAETEPSTVGVDVVPTDPVDPIGNHVDGTPKPKSSASTGKPSSSSTVGTPPTTSNVLVVEVTPAETEPSTVGVDVVPTDSVDPIGNPVDGTSRPKRSASTGKTAPSSKKMK